MLGYWKALSRSVKTHCVGKEAEVTHSLHLLARCCTSIKVKWAWNNTTFCLHFCLLNAGVSVILLVSAFMCTREGTLCPTGHMSCARATEGGQLSGFVLSMGHHLIPLQSRDWDRAPETTATNCSLSVRQTGGRGSYVGGIHAVDPYSRLSS